MNHRFDTLRTVSVHYYFTDNTIQIKLNLEMEL